MIAPINNNIAQVNYQPDREKKKTLMVEEFLGKMKMSTAAYTSYVRSGIKF